MRYLFCLVLFMLTSCANQSLKPLSIKIPENYKNIDSWRVVHPSEDVARGDWWKGLNDIILDNLIVKLDASNNDLAAALAQYEQANALDVQARSGFFPVINASAASNHDKQSDNRPLRSSTQPNFYEDHSASLSLQYEVDLWGRVHDKVSASRAYVAASKAEYESVHLSLRARLVNDYIALRSLDLQKEMLENLNVNYVKIQALINNRYRGGVGSMADLYRANAQIEAIKIKLLDISARRSLFEHAIATLVGEPASDFSITPEYKPMELPLIPLGIPADLLERRPDIVSAERLMEAANAKVGIAKTAFFPTFTISTIGGYDTSLNKEWLTAPNTFWAIGPSAVLTIFDAGRRKAEVAQAKAGLDQAAAKYRASVLSAFQEVEDNLSDISSADDEILHSNTYTTNYQSALSILANRYHAGVASYLDVVSAENALLQSQLDEVAFREKRLHATINLIRSLGGGWKMN